MAASRPTRALLQKIRVIDVSNKNVPRYFLLLEMALQAERRVAFVQKSLIHRSVGGMTDHATLTHGLMFINKWSALLCVTFEAGFVSRQESKSASSELLLNVCRRALGRDALVRFMAIAATHLALKHRVMMGQLKRCAHVQMTLKTSVRRFSRIDDRALSATSLNMQTPGPVARFATDIFGVVAFRLQACVSSCPEVADDLLVTGSAFL